TEIDDAFSVRELADGDVEIGIHIALPAIAIRRDSSLDRGARARLSTIYMPGRKLTMLPEAAVDAFTLRAGTARPALSLYVETRPDAPRVAPEPRIERIHVAATLRLDEISEAFVEPLPSPSDAPWTHELRAL